MRARSISLRALSLAVSVASPLVASCGDGQGWGPSVPAERPSALRIDDAAHDLARPSASVPKGGCRKGMVLVQGGSFRRPRRESPPPTVAPSPSASASAAPAPDLVTVDVPAFCMDKTEVTAAAYRGCVVAERCTLEHTDVLLPGTDARWIGLLSLFCNAQRLDRRDHPMNCVDFNQAEAYCRAAGGRLPTEDEWEWAARGGEEARPYPWGDEPPNETRLNACGIECQQAFEAQGATHKTMYQTDDGFPGTAPVGSFPKGASRDGILDLGGNVFEWTSTEAQPGIAVDRGGAFSNATPDAAKAGTRHVFNRSMRDASLGFRCASDPG